MRAAVGGKTETFTPDRGPREVSADRACDVVGLSPSIPSP